MNKVITTMVGALLLGAAVPALAQTDAIKPVGLSARIGLFFPTDDTQRDSATSYFAGGLDYKLPFNLRAMGNTQLTLSLDYAAKDDYRVVPLLVNANYHRDQFYAFAGVGLAFSRRPTGGGTEDKTRFAYQAGIGYDFHTGQNPIFVEGKFIGNDWSELNGFGVFVGVRL